MARVVPIRFPCRSRARRRDFGCADFPKDPSAGLHRRRHSRAGRANALGRPAHRARTREQSSLLCGGSHCPQPAPGPAVQPLAVRRADRPICRICRVVRAHIADRRSRQLSRRNADKRISGRRASAYRCRAGVRLAGMVSGRGRSPVVAVDGNRRLSQHFT